VVVAELEITPLDRAVEEAVETLGALAAKQVAPIPEAAEAAAGTTVLVSAMAVVQA
jgi:hypothetical protein